MYHVTSTSHKIQIYKFEDIKAEEVEYNSQHAFPQQTSSCWLLNCRYAALKLQTQSEAWIQFLQFHTMFLFKHKVFGIYDSISSNELRLMGIVGWDTTVHLMTPCLCCGFCSNFLLCACCLSSGFHSAEHVKQAGKHTPLWSWKVTYIFKLRLLRIQYVLWLHTSKK